MNGQRFHQQKRIETKTEQCERSHNNDNSKSFLQQMSSIIMAVIMHFKARHSFKRVA